MSNSTLFRRVCLLMTLAASFPFAGIGQTLPPPLSVSPNAASLEKYTEVPVNLFTGTPDISIPIHKLKYGGISVPIALRYNPASVKPGQQPGWVGLGWDLQSFGIITRTVRGVPDDLFGSPGTGDLDTEPSNAYNSYYPDPGNSANFAESGSQLANDATWSTSQHLLNNFQVSAENSTGINDVQADEFTFNFMGYSGTFYYSGPTLGWQVVSDDNIKITLNTSINAGTAAPGFLQPADIYNVLEQFQPFQQQPCNNCAAINLTEQTNQFGGFTLTVPDGTQYVFGGVNATEFESNYWFGSGFFFQLHANAWLLSKIIDVNQNEVDFTYQRTFPTCSLSFGLSEQYITASTDKGEPCATSSFTYSDADTTTHGGNYEWPMYLSKISSPNETINFTIANATCLRYPNNILLSQTADEPLNAGPLVPTPTRDDQLIPTPVNGTLNNLQWEQLNEITITNSAGSNYKNYNFYYSNSPAQRLTLNSFVSSDNTDDPVEIYSFGYNGVANMTYLTPAGGGVVYYDGNGTDHWGFFNGQNLNGINSVNMYAARQTNASLVTTGLLTQITYPTGGYTILSWQPHDYAQVVSVDRQSLVSATGSAGGSRISEIKSFDINGSVLLDKNYIYKAGYTAGSNIGSLTSSGVLNGTPQYGFIGTGLTSVSGNTTVSIYQGSLQSLAMYSYGGMGSYIGYNEVAEVNADGSYTRHFFTNYGADLNGVSHFDILPVNEIGWVLGQSSMNAYLPMNSLEGERGKPTGLFEYTSGNTLVAKTSFTYRNDAARFNSYIKLIDFGGLFACNPGDALVLESAREQYTYDYYPLSKTVTTYDQAGLNPVVSSETYNSYDANNMLTRVTTVNSRGETVVTNYTYTSEANDATSIAMAAAHILTPVIQTTVTNNGNLASQTNILYTSAVPPCPASSPIYYLPQTVQIATEANVLETRQQFYQYDVHGNVQEEAKTGDNHTVYLWGYNSQYMVAKITNSTYTAVKAAMTTNSITQTQLDNPLTTDAAMRAMINTLRTALPNSQVIAYTYAPVIGMTSETDAKGEITYYQYDNDQRLANILDTNGNIVKHYDYHYTGQHNNN